MIPFGIDIKTHDELLGRENFFSTQVESGNPFLDSQFCTLSIQEISNVGSSCERMDDKVPSHEIRQIFEKSLESSLRHSQRQPGNPAVLNNLGLDYLNLGRIQEASDVFTSILSTSPGFFQATANLAKCHLVMGNLDESLRLYLKVEVQYPDDVRVLSNIAFLYLVKTEIETSLSYLKKAGAIAKGNHSIITNIGLVYLLKRNYKGAISKFREALKIKANDPEAYNNMGVCFDILGSTKKALNYLKIAYKLNSGARYIVSNLANVLVKEKRYQETINIIQIYYESNEKDVYLQDLLAKSYFMLKEYNKSFRELTSTLEHLNPDNNEKSRLLNNLGVIYSRQSKYTDARDLFRESITTGDTKGIIPYCNLIDNYLRTNNADKMHQTILEAIEVFGENAALLFYYGKYYEFVGDYDKAKQYFSNSNELEPNKLGPYLSLSLLEIDLFKDYDRAIEIIEKGLKRFPRDLGLMNNYAYVLSLMDRFDKTSEVLDRVFLDIDHTYYLSATKGFVLIRQGFLKEGIRYYDQAIRLAGNNTNLVNLIKQKKFLEIGRFYYEHDEETKALNNLKKGLKYKVKHEFYLHDIESLITAIEQTYLS